MARSLSNLLFFCFLFAFIDHFGQSPEDERRPKDYKDKDQFDKFQKRRKVIGAWQINQLKEGALVVRLKTNKILIEALVKEGKLALAEEKQKEQYAINRNTLFAYKDHFNFCKLYFIYSNSSDSLLNGARTGMFLDTNLNVDPTIVMAEKFYVVAERDYAYNSSIGFVSEDSARTVLEKGNPVREMAIVIKNKYYHQLKGPFPYYIKEKNFMDATYDFPITAVGSVTGGMTLTFRINKTYFAEIKEKEKNFKTHSSVQPPGSSVVKLKKHLTYEKLAISVDLLNENLERYYKESPKPQMDKIDKEIIPFLY